MVGVQLRIYVSKATLTPMRYGHSV